MAIIQQPELTKLRRRHPGKRIVYCSGSFDLPHAGHVLFFEDCKRLGDILVVGVGPDQDLRQNKGPDRPVLNQAIRLKTVDAFKPVDYCFLGKTIPQRGNPLSVMAEVFRQLAPETYAINQDAGNIPYRRQLCRRYRVKLVILERRCPPEFEAISTSKIIQKIKGLV